MSLIGLAIVILASGFLAARARRLLASALWLAGTSALAAIFLYLLGAYEVAVIELSVGAGLVTVLLVFAINIAGEEKVGLPSVVPRGLAWLLCLAPLAVIGALILPQLTTVAPPAVAGFVNVLWQDRALDVIVQVVLIYAGVLGLLGLLAEKEAPLRQPVAREVAEKREQALLTMETAARHEEVQL
ncbi:MAG TPA: hydrogenase subunit MbhD domain-containing protein [Anaerolineales bacterium]|nr:hydrogenase subunit MbhD domain-containing protein [Anaerolineales bacterium]